MTIEAMVHLLLFFSVPCEPSFPDNSTVNIADLGML